MQIVIDIPEEIYEEYVSVILGRGNGKTITDNLLKAVKNGTPLDDIRAEIEQAADKQFQIAMGVADLNERYTHVQMENAYRHSLDILDKYRKEE